MGIFDGETECRHCGSKEHASDQCPHEHGIIFNETECQYCTSREHASDQCPHDRGIIFSETECRHCGSKNHSSDDCPHERGVIFSETDCRHCGSKNHSSEQCPHERSIIFSEMECRYCGSKDHSSDSCPHERGIFSVQNKHKSSGSSKHASDEYLKETRHSSNSNYRPNSSTDTSEDTGDFWVKVIGWLIGVGVIVFVVVWLAFNVVLPVTLLNSALILTVLALVKKQQRVLFSVLALAGGFYMFLDISNGWFSNNFINNVVKDNVWITAFTYINAASIGVSTLLLILPLWLKANNLRSTSKQKSILLKTGLILLVTIATLAIPVWYNSVQEPLHLHADPSVNSVPNAGNPTQQSGTLNNSVPQNNLSTDSSDKVTVVSDTLNNSQSNTIDSSKAVTGGTPAEKQYHFVTCPDCNGKGEVTANVNCTTCNGSGKEKCDNCNGKGYNTCNNCSGKGYNTCNNCAGKGSIIDSYTGNKINCTWCAGKGTNPCTWCQAKGNVPCTWCTSTGKVSCKTCYGKGILTKNITCPKCEGKGQIRADI